MYCLILERKYSVWKENIRSFWLILPVNANASIEEYDLTRKPEGP